MKDQNEVIEEFNELVNMTASELEKWLKSDDSNSAGWPKEEENGESVGHDSGRKIVEILKSNPKKDPEKYTEDHIEHMRKVVSYCKRHLAQESKTNSERSPEEVKKTKSYASLKNWGHDFLKKSREDNGDDGADEKQEEDDAGVEDEEKQAGDKRKTSNKQEGSNKKRETSKGKTEANGEKEEGGDDNESKDEEKGDEGDKKSNGNQKNGKEQDDKKGDQKEGDDEGDDDKDGAKPKKGPKKGETVSWNWGNGQPEGKVLDVKTEKTRIETKRGNEVSRDGDSEDPAVVIDTGKSKAIKSNHELN